jgi:hypothetical protein
MRITAKLQLDKIRKPKDLFEKLNMLNMRKCKKIEKRLGELKREVKFVNQSFLTKSGIITDLLNEAEVTFKIGKDLHLAWMNFLRISKAEGLSSRYFLFVGSRTKK